MKKRLLALTLSGLMLISSISPANIQAYASEPSDAFSTISGNDLPANQNEETGEESEETQESTETTNLDLNDFFDWDLSNSGFADISGNDAYLLTSLATSETGRDLLSLGSAYINKQMPGLKTTLSYTANGETNTLTKNSEGKYKLPESILPSDIQSFKMRVELDVIDEGRTLQGGDYFTITLPDGIEVGAPTAEFKTEDQKNTWATVSKNGQSVQFQFTNVIAEKSGSIMAFRNLSGWLEFEFNFSQQELAKLGAAEATYSFNFMGDTITISVPKASDDISKITKTGTFDAKQGLIHWTVNVGEAKDKTVSLEGYTFEDEFSNNQTLVKGSVKIGDTVAEDVTPTANGFTFTFGDVKAPQTVKYDTAPDGEFYLAKDVVASNTAKVTSTKAAEGQEPMTASASVKSPGQIIQKEGVQVSANLMQWTITYNEAEVLVYGATVYDDLSDGLKYDKSSLKLNGKALPISGVEDKSNGQKVAIDFDKSVASNKYVITFNTEIDPKKFSGQDTSEGTTIENKAYVTARFPSGTGVGEYTEYQVPEVSTAPTYSAAFLEKEVVRDANKEKEGKITWKIHPSTKDQGDFYDTAVVNDVLQTGTAYGEHTWIDGSVQVKAGTYTLVENDELQTLAGGETNPCRYNKPNHSFEFSREALAALNLKLDDVTITVQTQAKDYLKDDNKHTYKNKASLTLKKGTTAIASANADAAIDLQNKLLHKTVTFEPSTADKDYFHYTILVNQNHMTLSNAVLTDDVSNVFYYMNGDTKTRIPAGYFEINNDKTEIYKLTSSNERGSAVDSPNTSYAQHTFSWTLPANTTDAYEVHLYAYLTATGRAALTDSLKDKAIYTDNKASLKADELGATSFDSNETNNKDAKFNTKILEKSGVQDGRRINWTVVVNAGSAELGTGVVFKDTIKKGLYLDADSIKVSEPTYVNNQVKPSDTNLLEQSSSGITKHVKRSVEGTAELTITFENALDKPYVINYTTEGVGKAQPFKNEASLEYGGKIAPSEATVNAEKNAWSTGYAVAVWEMTKVDALSTDEHQMPLEGAVYALLSGDPNTFKDAKGNIKDDCIVDLQKTDAEGKAYFVAKIEAGKEYYIAEVSAPENYVRDTKIYGPYKATDYGLYKIDPEGVETKADKTKGQGTFKDKRVESTNTVASLAITKEFDTEATGDFVQKNDLEKTASFTLYIYPDRGTNPSSTFKRTVEFTEGDDGSYTYAEQNGAASNKTKLTATGTDASLNLKNLPWGHYELVETAAAAGYLPKAKLSFKVDATGKLNFESDKCVDAEAMTNGQAATAKLKNYRTQITLKKTDNVDKKIADAVMEGVEFELTPAESTDALVEANGIAGSTEKLTFTGEQLSNGVTLYGLCKLGVKYTLTETKAPKGYQKITKPVTFKINDGTNGTTFESIATVGGTTGYFTAKNGTITLKNTPTAFGFVKQDQNGLGVANVDLTISPKEGSSFAHAAGTGAVNGDGNIILTTTVNDKGAPESNTITGEMVAGNTYVITENYRTGFDTDAYLDAAGYKAEYKVSDDGKELIDVTPDSVTNKLDVKFTNATTKNSITITNHRVLAQMAMTKVDAEDNDVKLAGASFKLYRQADTTPKPASDVEITSFDTDADGTWKTEAADDSVVYQNQKLSLGLPVGNYYLVETTAPQHYQIAMENGAAKTYSFSVTKANDGKTITVDSIGNDRILGTLTFTSKEEKTGKIVPGVTYGLYEKNGSNWNLVNTVKTGTNGDGKIEKMPWGKEYALIEIQDEDIQPSHYVLDETVYTTGADLDHPNVETTIQFGTPAVTGKTDTVLNVHADLILKPLTVDINFDTTVNRFESGIPAAAQKEVPVQGIQYTVYEDEEGKTPVMVNGSPLVVTSDADGKVTIPGLSVNTDEKPYYYIKETGYAGADPDQSQLSTKLTDTVYRAKVTGKNFDGIQVKDGGSWKSVENNQISHDTYTGTVTVTKQGEGNTPLPGAVYGVYRELSSYPADAQPVLTNLIATKQLTSYTSNGETWILLDQKTTDDSGKVHFDTPVAGEEYMIREIQSPAGYTPSEPILVTMKVTPANAGGTPTVAATLSNGSPASNITQNAPKVSLKVKTLSNTNPETALGPVHLVLTDDAGRVVDEWGTTVVDSDEVEVDENGDPVLDENSIPKKKKKVEGWNHQVTDTGKLLVVGKTYTVTATTVPSGFAKTSMKFTLKPATSQVEQIVIGKYVAPAPSNSNSGSSHSDNHGGQNSATPDKSKVTDPEQTDSQIVVINQAGTDDGSHIKDKTGLNGKKRKNGTSVATAGSRKENGVVRSVRRALEAAFGAISGSYRKLVTKTGDEAPIIGMIALLLIAVVGIITVMIHKRKKK